jgi:uncharacterized membrane protein YhhN
MILLMAYAAQEADLSIRKSLLITLFFSLLGDVFLMVPGTNPLYFHWHWGLLRFSNWVYFFVL